MANDLRTIELLIKATAEQGVSQRTAEQLEAIAGQLFQVGKTAEVSTGKLASMTAAIARLTNNTELGRVAEQFRAIGDAASEAGQQVDTVEAKTTRTGGGGFRQSAEFQVGRSERLASTVLTAIPGGGAGIADNALRASGALTEMIARLQILTETSGSASGAVLALTAEMAPLLIVMAAITAAVALLSRYNDEAKKSVEAQTEALRLFYKTIEEGTSATIEKAIADNERQQRESKGVIADLDKQMEALKTTVDPNKNTLQLRAEYNNLQDQRDKEQQTLDKLTEAEKKLVEARGSEEVALRDAAIARGKTADTAIDEAVREDEIRRRGTSKGLVDEIDSLTTRRDAMSKELGELNKRAVAGTAQPEDVANQKKYIDGINQLNTQLDADKKLLPFVRAREAEQKAIDDLLKAQDERNKELAKELDAVQRLTEQMDQLQADRDKTLRRQAEQDAIDATRNAISATYAKKIQDAKDQEAEADYQAGLAKLRDGERMQERKLSESYQRQVDKINGSYMDTELKALATFRDKEADELAKFNKQYARALEDLQDKLTDAASRRDVAGFIQAQRDGEKQLRRMAEDFGDQDKARVTSYAKERVAARDNRQQQLAEAERGYREQMQQLRDQLQERLDQERQAHERRIRQSQIYEDEFAALQEQWHRDDIGRQRRYDKEDFDAKMGSLQAELNAAWAIIVQTSVQGIQAIGQAKTPTAQLATGVSVAGSLNANAFGFIQALIGGAGGTPSGGAPGFTIGAPLPMHRPGQFAGGLPFVPSNFFPAYLDYGERVLNRRENQAYSSGRSGGTTVNVYNTVGDVATKSMLDSYQVETVRAVRRAVDR